VLSRDAMASKEAVLSRNTVLSRQDRLVDREVCVRWQVQEAKQRFSEMLRAVTSEGPQTISRHGQDAFVVIGIDEYRRLTGRHRDLKAILLGPPYFSDEMSTILGEIEEERRRDRPRSVDLPADGPGGGQ